MPARRRHGDFAVLYRTNALSRLLEHAFRARGIPYQVVRGIEFYKRKEIKDILAYLQLILNPRDDLALLRVINCAAPRDWQDHAAANPGFADQHRLSLLETLRNQEFLASLSAKFRKTLQSLVGELDRLTEMEIGNVELAVRGVLERHRLCGPPSRLRQ